MVNGEVRCFHFVASDVQERRINHNLMEETALI